MRGTLCGKANRGRVKAVFFLLAVIISLLVGLNLGGCVPAPRNYGEAESVGYQGIVLTDHSQIRNKLRGIAGTFDESNFADNLVAVYDYVKSLPYYYDSEKHGVGDFWQTGPETIEAGGGDCEDHAILLVTLIEALYRETYGTIPQNLVWVVAGVVKVGSGTEGAGHAWAIINLRALPEDALSRIRNTAPWRSVVDAIVGDIVLPLAERIEEVWEKLDLARLADKRGPYAISVLWGGDEYVELESTWGSAISEYVEKAYPYTQVYVAFNSQQYVLSPQFVPSGRPVGSGATIRNVGFNRAVKVNEKFSIKVTVRNIDLGDLGATLVLVVKSGGREVTRESAYVFKYLWSIHTFSFDFIATNPGTRHIELELYWDDQGSLQLQESAEFDITAVDGSVTIATTQGAVTVMRTVTVQRTIEMTITVTRTVTRTATLTRTVHTTVLRTVTANPLTVSQTRTGVVTSTVYSPTVSVTLGGAQEISNLLQWLMLSTFVMIPAVVPVANRARLRTLCRRAKVLLPFRLTMLTRARVRESVFAMSLISLIFLSVSSQVGQQASANATTTTLTVTVTEWATLIQSVTSTRYITSMATGTSTFTRTDFTTITPTTTTNVDRRSTTTVYVPTTITDTARKLDTRTTAFASSPVVQANWLQTTALVMVLLAVVFAAWYWSRRRPREKPRPAWVFCIECGAENPTTNEYCGMCGKRLVAKRIHDTDQMM